MSLYIESPITGSQIEVAENDFVNRLNWEDAIRECQNLGNGWRLPSIKELKAMYNQLHSKGEGNFKPRPYWSSSVHNPDDRCEWHTPLCLWFSSNGTTFQEKNKLYFVRAVRSTLP